MNVTVALLLAPLAVWVFPVSVPAGVEAVVWAQLPPACNATGPAHLRGPATYVVACVNPDTQPIPIQGQISIQYATRQPPAPEPASTAAMPLLAVAAATAAAAGASAAYSRREELAASLLAVLGRIKRARAESPVRRTILNIVEESGAVTAAQLVRRTGLTWGQVQWHLYVLEREGRLRSIKVGPFLYYFVDPRAAAKVILSSVDPSALTPEDRERLRFLAS